MMITVGSNVGSEVVGFLVGSNVGSEVVGSLLGLPDGFSVGLFLKSIN